jgi:hypothetical protein
MIGVITNQLINNDNYGSYEQPQIDVYKRASNSMLEGEEANHALDSPKKSEIHEIQKDFEEIINCVPVKTKRRGGFQVLPRNAE